MKNQKGQTSIEYIFMLVVVVILVLSVSKALRRYMVGPGKCPNESLYCTMEERFLSQFNAEGNYRFFRLIR